MTLNRERSIVLYVIQTPVALVVRDMPGRRRPTRSSVKTPQNQFLSPSAPATPASEVGRGFATTPYDVG